MGWMLLTHHARTLHAPYTHHALAARTLLTPSPLPHVQVGWLLLSLTDPMGPPGPVLEAVLSAGGEVSGQ